MNKNNNYFSKTLLCLAVGGGLTYIRKFKNNNNIETNNIDTIFNKVKNTNNAIIYTKEERSDIFNEFIKSKNTNKDELKNNNESNTEIIQSEIIETEIIQSEIIQSENNDISNDINHITNNQLIFNTQSNNNIYKFYTKKDYYYKIQINTEILDDLSSILINFNNFKYHTETNEKYTKFIFDNIIFDMNYQTLEVKEINNKSFGKFNILIKEYPINNLHINNGIIIVIENNNLYPYYLNNNILPNFIQKDDF
jgi:hypothetical protein